MQLTLDLSCQLDQCSMIDYSQKVVIGLYENNCIFKIVVFYVYPDIEQLDLFLSPINNKLFVFNDEQTKKHTLDLLLKELEDIARQVK